jgi:poly(hydroxyalkanoate) depolymerase family esterase
VSASLLNGAARAASLVEVTNFGTNPSGLRMYLYVPNSVKPRPAVLVASHYCTGSGPAFYSGTQWAALADQYGFIVIYPSATRSGQCFDVSSPQTLRHDGGSDSQGIVSMVKYVLQRYSADPNRVYATGGSSGAMMTNVLLGAYPDVFKAGAAFAGVPFACFATTNGSLWNTECANGQIIKTPQQWGDLVRAAYPGYSGPRPRMQVWHGTEDTTLRYQNFTEEIKEWTNVHGLNQTPAYTDHPQTNWTRTRYGGTGTQPLVEAVSIQGAGHGLPGGLERYALQFLGLDTTPSTPTPTRVVTPTPVTPTATRTPTPVTPTPGTPTPTSTPTPVTPTPVTPTATPGGSTPCSPVTGTVTAPYSYDGAGTFCWQIANIPNYINSWNLTSLKINGVDFSNIYAVPSGLPPKINGFWYVSYSGQYPWSHFEAK